MQIMLEFIMNGFIDIFSINEFSGDILLLFIEFVQITHYLTKAEMNVWHSLKCPSVDLVQDY